MLLYPAWPFIIAGLDTVNNKVIIFNTVNFSGAIPVIWVKSHK